MRTPVGEFKRWNSDGQDLDQLSVKIHDLSDVENLRLVDAILRRRVCLCQEIDRVWAEETRKRWAD